MGAKNFQHIPKTEENKSIATWRPNSIGMKTSKSVEKRREKKQRKKSVRRQRKEDQKIQM